MEKYNYESILSQVLKHEDYVNYTTQPEKGKYRQPTNGNSSPLVLDKNGLYDHVSDQLVKTLHQIAIECGIIEPPKSKAQYIFDKSEDEPNTIKRYFDTRGIDIPVELIKELGLRVNRHTREGKTTTTVIVPLKTPSGELAQLQAIPINPETFKKSSGKQYRDKYPKGDRGLLIKRDPEKLVIFEGIEDGLTYHTHHDSESSILISFGTGGFSRVSGFVDQFNDVTAILDNDKNDASIKAAPKLPEKVKCLIPGQVGIDANKSWLSGGFQEWIKSLTPYQPVKNKIKEENTEPIGDEGDVVFQDFDKVNPSHDDPGGVVSTLNNKHAVIMVQGKTVIMNNAKDSMFNRETITLSAEADFKRWYCNKFIKAVNPATKKEYPRTWASHWLSSPDRRQYEGFYFDPSGNNEKKNLYNLWQGFAVEPVKGNCSEYYAHIFENIAQENIKIYEYILDWMADAVQNPTKLSGIAFVLRGGQGCGKGTAISLFCKLFGQHSIHVSNAKHVIGHFNAHLKDCLVLFADEAFWAGDKQGESTLKTLITEDIRLVEYKGKDSIPFPNYTRLMMSSNKSWVAPLDMDDRRFFILDVSKKRANDASYFTPIYDQMLNKGGLSALLYDLQKRDLTNTNIKKIPKTQAILDNKLDSLDSTGAWYYATLQEGGLVLDNINIKNLYQDYKDSCGSARKETQNSWSRKLKKYHPDLVLKRKYNEPARYYNFKSIEECRIIFEDILGHKINWDS
jgi:hypothetical protein